MHSDIWIPDRPTPPPVVDGALRDLYRRERKREQHRWSHIRDPRIDKMVDYQMAIAVDATSDGGRATAANQTYSHTSTGSNLLMLTAVLVGAVENMTSGSVTYNGVAHTMLGSEMLNHATNYKLSLWYLIAPATGAHNVVVTPNSSSDTMAVTVTYSGVSQTGFPDASGSRQPAQASQVTESLTTIADNCWMTLVSLDEFGTSMTAGAGTTIRKQNSGYGGVFIADSNGSVGAAGSHSLVINASNSADWMNDIFVSFAPAGSGTVMSMGSGSLSHAGRALDLLNAMANDARIVIQKA